MGNVKHLLQKRSDFQCLKDSLLLMSPEISGLSAFLIQNSDAALNSEFLISSLLQLKLSTQSAAALLKEV